MIPCCICNKIEIQENNHIIFCSKCNIAIHPNCYGISVNINENWLCKKCEANSTNNVCFIIVFFINLKFFRIVFFVLLKQERLNKLKMVNGDILCAHFGFQVNFFYLKKI